MLFQTILPGAALAAPTGSPPTTPPTLPPQQAPTEPVEEDVEIAPPLDDRPAPASALPVALFVTLTSDRSVLYPGETLTFTVNAWRATEERSTACR